MYRIHRQKSRWAGANTAVVLAVSLLLSAGCSAIRKTPTEPADDLRATIEKSVSDEERRADLLALTDQWEQVLHQMADELIEGRNKIDGLVNDYGSEREDFEKFFADYAKRRTEIADRVVVMHVAMKDLATDEEWASLDKAAQRMTKAVLSQDLAAAGGGI